MNCVVDFDFKANGSSTMSVLSNRGWFLVLGGHSESH